MNISFIYKIKKNIIRVTDMDVKKWENNSKTKLKKILPQVLNQGPLEPKAGLLPMSYADPI